MTAYPHPHRKYVDFGKLITDTWRLVWRHKFLWFFGLFAGGSTSLGGWNGNFSFDVGNQGDRSSGQPDQAVQEVSDWITSHLTLILILAAAIAVMLVLIWLWSIICRGAVIGSVRDARQGQPISFGSAFSRGREAFRRLLIFDLFLLLLALFLVAIFTAITLIIIFLVAVAGVAGKILLGVLGLWLLSFIGFGLGLLLCCTVWFLPWLLLAIIVMYATRAVVLEQARPVASLRRAGRLMMENLTQTLFFFLISIGLGVGATIIIVIAGGVSSIPAIIAWSIAYGQGWPTATIVIASILLILPLGVLIVLAALMNTYFTSFWTIAFDKIAGNEPADEPKWSRPPTPALPTTGQ